MSRQSGYPGSNSIYSFTGNAPRVSPTGVRQLGTKLGIGPVQIPQMNAVQGTSVQLPNSVTSKLEGIAPNQNQYEPETANMYQQAFNADPEITGPQFGQAAAGYIPASADTELAFNGQTDMGAGIPSFTPQPETPYKSTFGEFEGIEGGRLGAALGGVQENILSGNEYLQNSDLTRETVDPQAFADEKIAQVAAKLSPTSGELVGNQSVATTDDTVSTTTQQTAQPVDNAAVNPGVAARLNRRGTAFSGGGGNAISDWFGQNVFRSSNRQGLANRQANRTSRR